MKLGMSELLLIAIVALIVLGPDKMPVYARKLGQALGEFKKYSSDITSDLKENVVDPLNEAAKPLREAVEPINELQKDLRNSMKDVTKSINEVGKEKKEEPAAEEKTAEEKPAEEATAAEPAVKEESAETAESAEKE